MRRIFLSQLKQLLPFVLLWATLSLTFYGVELATSRVDEISYLKWCSDYCDVGSDFSLVIFAILLYMLAAYTLFPKDFDDGTIDFLRSLPVTRGQIFIAKVAAAWLLICALLLIEGLILTALLTFNTQSITGRAYFATDMSFFVRNCLFAFVIISHGVFISWFRTVGLVIYAAYLIGLVWLEQSRGVSGPYNLFRFFNNEYDGQRLLIDWPVIGFQLLVAVLLMIVSYKLWTSTDSKPRATQESRFSRILPALISVAAFFLLTGILSGLVRQSASDQNLESVRSLSSEYFRFAYKQSDEQRMHELLPYADDDYLSLTALLDINDIPRIQADMTSQSTHALGVASYKKIRMVLSAREPVDPVYRRVLSHESTHVLQTTESNRKLASVSNSVGFFIEGMAQYTSFKIVPDPPTRISNWAISSIAWKRFNISFDTLANRAVFESLYDPELLYGIGDIWTDAMVQVCGEDSLGAFLRSNASDDAPRGLSGTAYWRHHLNDIGCSLEQVNHTWRQQMQQIVDERTDGAFPTFSDVIIDSTDTHLTVTATMTPDDNGEQPQRYYIRVESETKLASTISPILIGTPTQQGDKTVVEFNVPKYQIEGRRFRYQLGYVPYPDSRYFFERWRSGAVPD